MSDEQTRGGRGSEKRHGRHATARTLGLLAETAVEAEGPAAKYGATGAGNTTGLYAAHRTHARTHACAQATSMETDRRKRKTEGI